MKFDSHAIRKQFPALQRVHNGLPMVFLDGPAGTQVPERVIDAISGYYKTSNSNTHGSFVTTRETDEVIAQLRNSMATFLGAEDSACISIGQNTTTLNFALARGMSRIFKTGDEVIITQLDHEANRGPWLTLTAFGVKVIEVKLLPSGVLDYEDLAGKLNARTKLVCLGMSSNCIGTVNDFMRVRALTRQHNAWLLLDAVHYAPHFLIDVKKLDCDFLLCSAYKFYGPHVGILYSKRGLLDQIPTDKLRPAGQKAPDSIETGTLNHAAIAGVSAAVDFISSLGTGNTLREKLTSAYETISNHEFQLASELYRSIKGIRGVTVIGQDFSQHNRTPTVSFTLEGKTPIDVCNHLASKNICAWDGHFYAIRAIEVLGLLERGGVTRLGISLYNTKEEIEKTIAAMVELANG